MQNFVDPLVSSRNPPWFDARGVSVGLVVGFLVPEGVQLVTLGALRLLFKFHIPLAIGFSFVTNPLDVVPLYYAYYYIGSFFVGKSASIQFDVFEKHMQPFLSKAYCWELACSFSALGRDVLIRWTIGAVVLALVFGILGYVVTYKIQKERCRKAAERLGTEYEEYIRQLEKDGGHKGT
jgi:uncharacterized protein (DUF2062 family)